MVKIVDQDSGTLLTPNVLRMPTVTSDQLLQHFIVMMDGSASEGTRQQQEKVADSLATAKESITHKDVIGGHVLQHLMQKHRIPTKVQSYFYHALARRYGEVAHDPRDFHRSLIPILSDGLEHITQMSEPQIKQGILAFGLHRVISAKNIFKLVQQGMITSGLVMTTLFPTIAAASPTPFISPTPTSTNVSNFTITNATNLTNDTITDSRTTTIDPVDKLVDDILIYGSIALAVLCIVLCCCACISRCCCKDKSSKTTPSTAKKETLTRRPYPQQPLRVWDEERLLTLEAVALKGDRVFPPEPCTNRRQQIQPSRIKGQLSSLLVDSQYSMHH